MSLTRGVSNSILGVVVEVIVVGGRKALTGVVEDRGVEVTGGLDFGTKERFGLNFDFRLSCERKKVELINE